MGTKAWRCALVVLVLVLGACGTQAPESTEQTADDAAENGEAGTDGTVATPAPDKLVWAEPDIYARAGWAIETDDANLLMRMGVLETLVRVEFDGETTPGLAESWQRVDDVTWEFTVRDGVSFHDGEPLTADAVVGALTFALQTPTPPRGFNPDVIDAVEAKDDRTVVIRTVEPDELAPLRLTGANTGILSPNAYGDGPTPNPLGTGTGPFVFVESVRDEIMELVANENYWGGEVGLAEVQVQIIPDGDVRAGMAQSGEAQIVRNIPIPSIPIIEGTAGVQLLRAAEPRTETLYFNNESPLLSQLGVRQAILHAIDREALATSVLEGAATPANGPFPEWQPWADPAGIPSYDYDPDRAQQLLAEAGYEPGELTIGLWTYPGRPWLPDLAVAIQGMLSQAGIQTDIRVADYAAVEPDVLEGDYDLFILSRSHLFDVYDPLGWFQPDYTCEGGYNLSHFCDPAFDAKVAEAATTEQEEARWAIYRDLSEDLQAQAVNGFLVHVEQAHAASDQLQNFQIHPVGHYLLTKDLTW